MVERIGSRKEGKEKEEKEKAAGAKEKATASTRSIYGEDRRSRLVDRTGTHGVGVEVTTACEVWDV